MFTLINTGKVSTAECSENLGYQRLTILAIYPDAICRTKDEGYGDWCQNNLRNVAVCLNEDGTLHTEMTWEDIQQDIENGFLQIEKGGVS